MSNTPLGRQVAIYPLLLLCCCGQSARDVLPGLRRLGACKSVDACMEAGVHPAIEERKMGNAVSPLRVLAAAGREETEAEAEAGRGGGRSGHDHHHHLIRRAGGCKEAPVEQKYNTQKAQLDAYTHKYIDIHT